MKSTIRLALILVLAATGQTKAQWVSLLNNPTSARVLGMGGVGTALISDNAAATLDNPAQLGIFSLDGLFNANTDFHNSFGQGGFRPDNSFDVNALNVGLALNRIWKGLPLKAGAGIGYSNMNGTATQKFVNGGPIIGGTESNTSNAVSLGVGLDYLIRFSLGFSYKWVTQRYEFQGSPTINTDEDLGAIAQIPISKLIAGPQKEGMSNNTAKLLYDVTVGYAMRNLSGYRWGNATAPTEADLGWSFDAGWRSEVAGRHWDLVSIEWSEQAGASPFYTDSTIGGIYDFIGESDTTWNYFTRYQKGLGHFGIWRNLVVGKGSQSVGIRRGGQIGLGEFIYIRAGAITDAGQTTYSTFGWGLRLDGLAKCLVFFKD
ncbi:MAG: hypothetical protein M1339_02325 [Bacteroidetes bacterium]|nr:hypothetical protein [Bacteroidota bacterium]